MRCLKSPHLNTFRQITGEQIRKHKLIVTFFAQFPKLKKDKLSHTYAYLIQIDRGMGFHSCIFFFSFFLNRQTCENTHEYSIWNSPYGMTTTTAKALRGANDYQTCISRFSAFCIRQQLVLNIRGFCEDAFRGLAWKKNVVSYILEHKTRIHNINNMYEARLGLQKMSGENQNQHVQDDIRVGLKQVEICKDLKRLNFFLDRSQFTHS